MNRRLGCLTGGGLLAAALTLGIVLVFFFARGGAMFSPGPLNAEAGEEALGGGAIAPVRSHADTGGRCAACHTAPWSSATLSDRCLACHSSVANELTGNQGLHARLRGQAASFDCRGCHTEHRGATATLTEIQADAFPHSATGYELTGHQTAAGGKPVACGDCHTTSITQFDVATCTDCHRQLDAAYMTAHVADFGHACLGCHDGVDRYSRKRFDHNILPFPLEGKHAEVACNKCHAGATTVAGLQSTKSACVDCHQKDDTHKGQFGTDCAGCHNTNAWPDAQFDHSKTVFPLTGKHEGVKCQDCHQNGVFKDTSQNCVGCHQKDDAHKGQFGTDCAGCHNTNAWPEAQFDHSKTAFPLTGKHEGVNCQDCHQNGVFKGTQADCVACHADPAFHKDAFGTRCADCHTTAGWQPATFNLRHTFPIDHGERGASTCRTCHPNSVKAYTCYGCHEHTQAETIARHAEEVRGDISDCVKCHPTGREEEGGGD
jgi:hypothetical protein